jgi:hypothetical protein
MKRHDLYLALTATLMLAGLAPVAAQTGPLWWSLDPAAPPGTPPTVVVLPSSDLQHTDLEVTIHGFYYETIQEQQHIFRRLSIAKLGDEVDYRVIGRPHLPSIVHTVGSLVGIQPQPEPPVVHPLEEVTIPGALIYPFQPPQIDHPGDPPPQFQWDQAFYQQTTTPYPPMRGAAVGNLGRWNGLDLVGFQTYPFRMVPASQLLIVTRRYLVTLLHPGTHSPQILPVSRRQERQYQKTVANYTILEPYRPVQIAFFAGDYLIITIPQWIAEVEPLAEQKRRRGYEVTVASTDETGTTCAEVQAYIADWWSAGDPGRDHYVLLVGDTNRIAVCPDENGRASDKVYACIDGLGDDGLPDVLPEVRIGRFPSDSDADVTAMVDKTLTYEAGYPGSGSWLDQVLLTSHEQDSNRYGEVQEDVMAAGYSTPPVFEYMDGGSFWTNADVSAAIDGGKGVVCYRGHGTPADWVEWNLAGESYDIGDVNALDNGNRTPVVFSIACDNNRINNITDAIGEQWLETTQRAVAHYGATWSSNTDPNHMLDRGLFTSIYDDGVVILADAITAAEATMMMWYAADGEENAWMYLLLGDPELKVWREVPPPMLLSGHPVQVPPAPGMISVTLHRPSGFTDDPVEFGIVCAYKPGEFEENRYTDATGTVQLPINPATPGTIFLTGYTEFDSEGVALGTIEVVEDTHVGEMDAPATRFALMPPASSAETPVLRATLPGVADAFELRLYDVTGRLRASQALGSLAAGEQRLPLSGPAWNALPDGVYWIEARARFGGVVGEEARARTRWLRLR